jgi:hypothetical protein
MIKIWIHTRESTHWFSYYSEDGDEWQEHRFKLISDVLVWPYFDFLRVFGPTNLKLKGD